ncbi:hypothetical protein [Nocardioides rubriscoriae]|uniref:hypothetical protein n=1 Tax=Nocardioides rubriscoriae TaxID=642762 RepID=UPI0011DFE2D3|nr:hypothetical protein [Nocardioides rubriscoriae]
MSSMRVLELQRRPRLLLVVGTVLLVMATAMAWWRSSTPEPLPLSETVVNASTKVGRPVYVGVFTAGPDFRRTLRISRVTIRTTGSDVGVTALLCRGGSIGVTQDPQPFCAQLVDPEGQDLRAGDGIVLQVVSDQPAVATIQRVRVAFREHFRSGTEPAGSSAVVRVLPG